LNGLIAPRIAAVGGRAHVDRVCGAYRRIADHSPKYINGARLWADRDRRTLARLDRVTQLDGLAKRLAAVGRAGHQYLWMRILVGLSDEVRVRNVNVESRNRFLGARFWQMRDLVEIEVVSRNDARGSRIPWAPGHVRDVPR